jgi:hypothetical protein
VIGLYFGLSREDECFGETATVADGWCALTRKYRASLGFSSESVAVAGSVWESFALVGASANAQDERSHMYG